MARPLRIEFEGAIYHVISRGNARQNIVTQTSDWAHLQDRLAQTVQRCTWQLLSFVFMPNHLHLFVRTRRLLVQHPKDWPWSSYGGYHDARRRVDHSMRTSPKLQKEIESIQHRLL